MTSLPARIINFFLGLINAKKLVEIALKHPYRSNKSSLGHRFRKLNVVSEIQVMGKTVVTLQSYNCDCNIHIIFFHGGAYLLEGSFLHVRLIEKIANEAKCRISFLDYPLAPEFNYKNTFEMVHQTYNQIINSYPEDKFMFMGDSAGGGLALAFAQKLVKEKSTVLPVKNILFSPWLDISMQNPQIKNSENSDKILPLKGLIEAGKKYAGSDDKNCFLLSPINGELNGVGDTMVFYGTRELFNADCIKLEEKVRSINAKFKFLEFTEMQHDWVLLPVPEAKKAIKIATNFIRS